MGKLAELFEKVSKEKMSDAQMQRLENILRDISNAVGPMGPQGPSGQQGPKPIAGVDYQIPKDGKDGKTPVKGVDYFDGTNGATPVSGLDYPDNAGFEKMIEKKMPGESYFKPIIEKIVKGFFSAIETVIDAAKIARALETLRGNARLDYNALKNTPTIPSEDQIGSKVRTIMRGGGDTVKTHDLDSLLDGVTKTFTLPKHRKIILVVATSAPFRFLVTTDYTRTETSITFTAAVDASVSLASGQGVSILYV